MRNLLLTSGLITLGTVSSAWGALTINLDYTNFGSSGAWGSLHNDAWDGSTSDATKQSAAEAVIQAAADYWETAFSASTRNITQTIDVSWSGYGGNTLASASMSWSGSPDYNISNGTLAWDNDGSSSFFVDLTPSDNSEWTESTFRSADLGGGSVNVERVFYNAPTSGAAFLHNDLLSVAIHEIAHTLGFVDGYPRLTALDEGGKLALSDGTEIDYGGGHHTYTLGDPDPGNFPADFWSIGSGTYYPTSMGPFIYTGTRKLLSEVDIKTVADIQALNNVNTNPLIPEPEPALVLLFSIGIALIFRRRSDRTVKGV